jgi:hypothetical protein
VLNFCLCFSANFDRASQFLGSMEGCGQLRLTEGLAQLFSKPNVVDNRCDSIIVCTFDFSTLTIYCRTMFWEDNLLTMACDWTKTQAMSGPARKSLQRKMVKTATARTSHIFIRCALVTKPAEARLISQKHDASASATHWASFVARNGESMATQRNYLWALALFNKAALRICKLSLNPLRHIWVTW